MSVIRAFPGSNVSGNPGMCLRDWFAGQACTGVSASAKGFTTVEGMAEWCYRIADAMLAARELDIDNIYDLLVKKTDDTNDSPPFSVYETVGQWEFRTGKTYPASVPVYVFHNEAWHLTSYGFYSTQPGIPISDASVGKLVVAIDGRQIILPSIHPYSLQGDF